MSAPLFWITTALVAVAAYLLGSINTAIIVSHFWAGDDIRKHGSGNAGMTNMLRIYGKGPATLTAVGDFLKAVVAVLLGRLAFWLAGLDYLPLDAGYLAGLFVLLGHLFPLYFHFKGGKGVMTCLGVMLVVNPIAFLIIAVVFVPLVFITKIVSLSSVLGAACYPFVTWGVLHFIGREPLYDSICAAIIAVIILVMHKSNIKRLLTGTENKFGGNKARKQEEEDE